MQGRTDQRGQFVLPVGEAQEAPTSCSSRRSRPRRRTRSRAPSGSTGGSYGSIPPIPPPRSILGNLLRARSAARSRPRRPIRAATKSDARFAEAWYNLADLLDDQRQPDKAVACLDALAADPDYADAIFNLGLLHQRADRYADAAACWRRYLALDNDSSWASRARRALKYCEMRIAQSS